MIVGGVELRQYRKYEMMYGVKRKKLLVTEIKAVFRVYYYAIPIVRMDMSESRICMKK